MAVSAMERTRVVIVGAGPAGLTLAQLLHLRGIDSVLLESRSREYVENRIRAGVLEQGTVDVLTAAGAGERLHREGIVHEGTILRFRERSHRIDFRALTGKAITIYGQHEVVRDLVRLRLATERPLLFEVEDVALEALDSERPRVRFRHQGRAREIVCDAVAGCDGFHGVCRSAIARHSRVFEREYPLGWLGILADAPPSTEEIVYAHHRRGFALQSMRSPSVSRLYLQCAPDADLSAWSDDRVWSELALRLRADDFALNRGPILQRAITPLRSYVVEPMAHGRLFLAGDAAHIVPPTGAKGLNLAIADVCLLAEALDALLARNDAWPLDRYSAMCLRRVWKVERFSWWMTSLLHRFDGGDFDDRIQLAELDYVTSSVAAQTVLAENYVGLPLS
jgi:p-hydroxybenzoate 3-monooxygenase